MILDLAFAMALMIGSMGLGLTLMSGCGSRAESFSDAIGLAVPLGLGILSLMVLGLGVAGMLSTMGITAVMVLGILVGLPGWARYGRLNEMSAGTRLNPRCEEYGGDPQESWPDRFVKLALLGGLIGTLLTALQPVTDGDALCYHLQVPKIFLHQHRVFYDPDLHETVYPLVSEMLDAVALKFRGPVACRLVTWIFGLSFVASTSALARPILGPRAFWAGAVAMLAPAVSNGMGAPLNDVVLASCATSALLALVRWWDRPSLGGSVLIGLLAGVSVGVKYPALVWSGLLGASILGRSIVGSGKHGERFRWRNLGHPLAFGVMMILVGGGWYLRAYLSTGNPVHPFFREVFGSGLDEVLDPIKRPLEVSLWNLVTALGPITLDPDRFDSLSHQFGPVFLLFLPTGLVFLRAPRRVWAIVGFGWVFLTVCLTQRQSMRFVLSALGPFSVGVAWSVSEWTRRGRAGRTIAAFLILILLGESALTVARVRHGLPVLIGRETPEAFLTRREPTFEVGRWIDEHLPENARLIGQDHRGFYIPRPYTMELAHRRRTGLASRGETDQEILAQIRHQGFTHLLICPPEPENAVEFDPTLTRRLEGWLRSRQPIYTRALTDFDGVVRRYSIYDLNRPHVLARAKGETR